MVTEQPVAAAILLFLRHRKSKNVARATTRLYTRLLRDWQEWRDGRTLPAALSSVTVEDFRGFLDERTGAGLTPNTVDSYRRTLRAFWRFLDGEGLLTEAQQGYWANGRIPRPLLSDPEPRPYCDEETLGALLDACGDGTQEESARNRAILLLLWESGARVGEACSLTDGDMNHRERRALVLGKGRKRGYLFWGPRTASALLRYLALRRGRRGGSLFRGCSSRNDGGPMTPNAVRLMVKHLGAAVPKGAPVHFIRHGFAHQALDAGLDVTQVQQLMRHASAETTRRYLGERPDKLQALHRRVLGLEKAPHRERQRNG